MYSRKVYTINQLKSLRHEYRVPFDENPFLGRCSKRCHDKLETPKFWYPELLPPGSRIIKLRPGQPLPRGSIPINFPIEERGWRENVRRRTPPCPRPGDSDYEFKYAPFFEPFMSKEIRSESLAKLENPDHIDYSQPAGDASSESSSESVQIQLPEQ